MSLHDVHGAAHKAATVRIVIAGLLLVGTGGAFSQATAPAAGGSSAPSEAARRAAESPFRFILLNAQPVKPKAAAPVEKPAPVEVVKKPAAAETTAALRPSPASAPAPEAAATPVAIASPKAPEPAPIVAVRRELVALKTEPPRLSGELMRQQPSGTVRVYFEVNPDGSTANVKVVSSTNRDLNRASIAAVQGWKFQQIDEAQSVETELVYNYQ